MQLVRLSRQATPRQNREAKEKQQRHRTSVHSPKAKAQNDHQGRKSKGKNKTLNKNNEKAPKPNTKKNNRRHQSQEQKLNKSCEQTQHCTVNTYEPQGHHAADMKGRRAREGCEANQVIRNNLTQQENKTKQKDRRNAKEGEATTVKGTVPQDSTNRARQQDQDTTTPGESEPTARSGESENPRSEPDQQPRTAKSQVRAKTYCTTWKQDKRQGSGAKVEAT